MTVFAGFRCPCHALLDLRRCLYLMLLVCLITTPTQASNGPLDDGYNKAYQAYVHGSLGDAQKLLQANLRIDPTHMPSLLLMAKLYYNLEAYTEAAKYYEKLDLSLLDPDSTFEYGVAMYGAKRCNQAIRAFMRLPKTYHLQSYARFYTGVCFLQRGDYDKALIKLRRALGLPPLMDSMRRHLITLARKNIETSNAGGNPAPLDETVEPESQMATKKGAIVSPFTNNINPQIETKNTWSESRNHSLQVLDKQFLESFASLTINSKYVFNAKEKSSPYIALTTTGKEYLKNEQFQANNLTLLSDQATYAWQKDPKTTYDRQTLEGSLVPSFTLPFGAKSSATVKTKYWTIHDQLHWKGDAYGDSPGDQSSFSSTGDLTSNVGDIDVDFAVDYTINYNFNRSPQEYLTTYSTSFSKNIHEVDLNLSGATLQRELPKGIDYSTAKSENTVSFSASLPLGKTNLYSSVDNRHLVLPSNLDYIAGDKLDSTTVKASVEQNFDVGLSLKFVAAASQFKGNAVAGLVNDIFVTPPPTQTAVGGASGTTTSYTFTLYQPLLEVLYISAMAKYETDTYQINEQNLIMSYRKSMPDTYYEGNIALGIKKTF